MGQTPKSLTAFANLKKICETHLKGRYRITVIDLLKQPQLAKGDQILAIPTVVRKLPQARANHHWQPFRYRARARRVGFARRPINRDEHP